MKNKNLAIGLIVFFTLLCFHSSLRAETDNELKLVFQAGQRDFSKFWPASGGEAKLDRPIRVYGLDKDAIQKSADGDDFSRALIPGNWVIPVEVNGKYKALFSVKADNGGYKGFSLQASSETRFYERLQKLRQIWSDSNGDNFKLISCDDPKAYFYTVTTISEPNLTPLTGGFTLNDKMWFIPPENLASPAPAVETIAELKEFWSKGLRWGPFGGLVS